MQTLREGTHGIVTSPDVLAKEELNQMEFRLTCVEAHVDVAMNTSDHKEHLRPAL
jgi:hypothetical protein